MITICTRWESSQMSAEQEWRMWRQLKGAFHIQRFVFTPIVQEMTSCPLEQFATMEEAIASCQGELVFLEPKGEKRLSDIPKVDDLTLVLSNTQLSNETLSNGNSYRINTPGKTDLYGINAAAIALSWISESHL